METKKTNVFAILFERKKVSEDENSTIYTYNPLEIVNGIEINIDDNKTLLCKNVKYLKDVDNDNINEETLNYEFPLISDPSCTFDFYAYGFPLIIDEKDKDNKINLNNYRNEMIHIVKNIKKYSLVHIINKNNLFNKVFLDYNGKKISVSVDNYYELFDLLYSISLGTLENLTSKKLIPENNYDIVLPSDYLYSDEIYNKVSKTVICQDEQIKKIASALAKNSRLESPSLKSTILLCGPTGVGKTEIFRVIRKNFDIPIAFEDATEYTAASFKGKDVIEMLAHLLDDAEGDIEKAQRGILVIDEIDKKVSHSGEHETYTTAVINSLLKMMEGHVYHVPFGRDEVEFDTSLLSFAFLGAFSGIENFSSKKTSIGFVTQEQISEQEKVKNMYTDETLKKYGLIPEFLGRCDTIVTMNNLGIDDFIKIIKTSDKSQLLLYKYLLHDIGIDFIYDDKTIEAIAKKANELGVGARSIKKIIENALAVADYQIFARNNYSELIISPETIEDNKQFILR